MKNKSWLLLICLIYSANVFSWNAVGHRLVAQIAYDHLTPQAKKMCHLYNRSLNRHHKKLSFVNASVWLDKLYDKRLSSLKAMHYIDIPFSTDGTSLSSVSQDKMNAVIAIRLSMHTLMNPQASFIHKAIAFRILLHVVGDIHQPLHAATRVSKVLPQGDKGGNLMMLGKNPIASNLHAYWDKGGGFLTTMSAKDIKRFAINIEKTWPCSEQKESLNPMTWAQESNALTRLIAYKIQAYERPSEAYQQQVQQITEKKIAKAGCRLAYVLNYIA